MLSYLRGWLHGAQAPRILVNISTADGALSWSGAGPDFFLVLRTTVEADTPITVYPDHTLLIPGTMALYKHGLTFTNTKTGEVAHRHYLSDCRSGPERKTAENTIEIPTHDTGLAYEVRHTFSPPTDFWSAHSSGLEAGQEYEIGLGEWSSKISWWKWGRKWEVFPFPFFSYGPSPAEGTPELQMILVNRAQITVVE